MPEPRLVSIVGKKNSGKTTLVVALVRELVRRGHRTMTIKHGAHPFEVDEEGKDTWRHMHEGGAERVVMESPEARVLIAHTTQEMGPREIATKYLSDAHFIVVEGFKKSDLPKVEVYRRAVHAQPLYDPASPDASQYIAIITDVTDFRANVPVLRFSDTNWLYRLVDLVSQGAR